MGLWEHVEGMAARQVHSVWFTLIYVIMALLSFVLAVWSFLATCPPLSFLVLDLLLALFWTYELLVRMLAVGRTSFLSRTFNQIDVMTYMICLVLLLLAHGCTQESRLEREGEALLLSFRNLFQLARIFLILRK